jgi:hypothetical protein
VAQLRVGIVRAAARARAALSPLARAATFQNRRRVDVVVQSGLLRGGTAGTPDSVSSRTQRTLSRFSFLHARHTARHGAV